MSGILNELLLVKAIMANPQIIRVNPSINIFLLKYMNKFTKVNVGGHLVLHSHLPPVNSKAFSKFINEHLLAKVPGPTHAQIGLTKACPQNCAYCYNRDRTGETMNKDTIIRVIKELEEMGVVWLGLTGGEPLLNKDIVEIIASVSANCAVKLFTGGYNLKRELAKDLKKAGLVYVSVSLDHWQEEEHNRIRGCRDSFATALKAIEIFQEIGGIHLGVSSVLTKRMLKENQIEQFIEFLIQLGVHEAWLSEAKPATKPLWDESLIISEKERTNLVSLQDRYNRQGRITVNYLGHFEGREHFGCNAGHKMIYIDAFGKVSPCVFSPTEFGNVNETSVKIIFEEMKKHFPSQNCCFVNKNYQLFEKFYQGYLPISQDDSREMMKEVQFGELSEFFKLYYNK